MDEYRERYRNERSPLFNQVMDSIDQIRGMFAHVNCGSSKAELAPIKRLIRELYEFMEHGVNDMDQLEYFELSDAIEQYIRPVISRIAPSLVARLERGYRDQPIPQHNVPAKRKLFEDESEEDPNQQVERVLVQGQAIRFMPFPQDDALAPSRTRRRFNDDDSSGEDGVENLGWPDESNESNDTEDSLDGGFYGGILRLP